MAEWQPIESAPRDGSWFVTVNASSAEPEYEVGCYQPYNWGRFVAIANGLFRQEQVAMYEFTHSNLHRATHWLALPALPEPPTTKDQGDKR